MTSALLLPARYHHYYSHHSSGGHAPVWLIAIIAVVVLGAAVWGKLRG